MPAGLASGLLAGWEWDYDGARWFYTFKANGHTQYHFPSEGDEFPDFVAVGEPVPDLKPEERLESHQQVKRATGSAPVVDRRKRKSTAAGHGMTATARPVGIEWDGDVGEESSGEEEEEGDGQRKVVVFQPENLMFLGPQTYAEVSPLNEDEEEAAKRTVVGVVKGQAEGAVVSPAETTVGTPAANEAELVKEVPEARKKVEEESGKNEGAGAIIMAEEVVTPETAKEESATREQEVKSADAQPIKEPARAAVQQQDATIAARTMSPAAARHDAVVDVVTEIATPPPAHYAVDEPHPPVVRPQQQQQQQQQPRYELAAPDTPFNPVGVIAEMPTEDTPRSHIEINPIPVEIMDTSVLAPIETASPPPLGVAESPAAVVKQTPLPPSQPPPQQRSGTVVAPPSIQMKIRRKPTDPNASIPSPLFTSSSAVMSPAVVSPPSVASPSPMSVQKSSPPPPPAAPATPAPAEAAKTQYKPYAPVSPLHRAETEPVRLPTTTTAMGPGTQQLAQESVTEPSSPVANPQLNYAPTVLRPAGQSRKLSSVSPERKQDGGGVKQGESGGGGLVQSGVFLPTQGSASNEAALGGMPQSQILPQRQVLLQGSMSQQSRFVPSGQMPPRGQPQGHMSPQGQMPTQGPPHGSQHSHLHSAPQWHAAQNVTEPPVQHGRPMSMAPGQYPPVPIPQPYGQYQKHPPQIGQWPGQPQTKQGPERSRLASGQQTPTPSYTIPLQQQQLPPGWTRQSMPPGYPSGQQPQQPPSGRRSIMAPSNSPDQHQPAPSPMSPSDPSLLSQGHQQAPTPGSSVVSPPGPRTSQPLGPSTPVPSSMEMPPQLSVAAQPTVSAPLQEVAKPGNVKVGTGSGTKSPTADSYFPPDKDHPIGLVGNVADQFAAEMQAILGSEPNSANTAKATNATEANPKPKTLVGPPAPGPGYMLGRIEERDAEIASVSAGSKQDSRSSSVATRLTESSLQPRTPQPQQPTQSQQSSSHNTPKSPQGFLPPLSGQPRASVQGMPQPEQTTPGRTMLPGGPMASQGPMPPQGLAPQQQWQGNMQRPLFVPPQLQMQPNKGKENKWTKWFKSSKPEKSPGVPQSGVPQQQPQAPQGWAQPQPWQGQPTPGQHMQQPLMQGQPMQGQLMQGQPIQGQYIQRQSVQGPPMLGQPMPDQHFQGQPMQGQLAQRQSVVGQPLPGQPVQRQYVQGPPVQRQPIQGQPVRGAVMGGSMPLQNMPMNIHPPYQMPAGSGPGSIPQRIPQQGPSGPHPPQQYMPLQPGQPMQMRPPHGFPMQQMQPGGPMMQMPHPAAPGSPAPSQMMPVQNPSHSSTASSPLMGFLNQSQQQTASPIPHNLMPAPLSLRPKSKPEVPAGMSVGGQAS